MDEWIENNSLEAAILMHALQCDREASLAYTILADIPGEDGQERCMEVCSELLEQARLCMLKGFEI